MIIELCAIGKLKSSEPEQLMAQDYINRAQIIGRQCAIDACLVELDGKTKEPNPKIEASVFLDRVSLSDFVIVLDEKGETLTSREIAARIEKLRDNGRKKVVFAIGGADGHGAEFKERANLLLSFGKSTWPHKLCRIMAAEQIYRALGIITNSPYHRD